MTLRLLLEMFGRLEEAEKHYGLKQWPYMKALELDSSTIKCFHIFHLFRANKSVLRLHSHIY